MRILHSFKKTVTSSMVFISFLAVSMVGTIWISGEYLKFREEISTLKEKYFNEQKEIVRTEVRRAITYIDYRREQTRKELEKTLKERVYEVSAVSRGLYNQYKDTKSSSEIKKLIKEAVRPMSFNQGRSYFFIYDMEGNNILFPSSPDLEGTNLINLKDSKGLYTIKRAINLVENSDEGFMEWHWYKPEDKKSMRKKVGFMKSFQPYNWLIGTGEYLEDFTINVKEESLEWIKKIQFGRDGYIFVLDYNSNFIAHYDDAFMNANLHDYRDPNGIPVVQELTRLGKLEGGGFLEYYWSSRPSTNKPGKKIAYSKAVNDWEWVVGAGVYIDEINDIIINKKQEAIKKNIRNISVIIIVLLLCLILVLSFSRYVANAISGNINRFNSFFEQSAVDDGKINKNEIQFSEFQKLAESANMMIDERNRAEKELLIVQEQLLRSRKMEALGLLAGGVAHDLNNVLSAVIGYPELILNSLPEDSPYRKSIQTIQESGIKAAAIVEDLLTLARRGVHQAVILDMNDLIKEYLLSPEHSQTMNTHTNIEIETILESDLMKIKGSIVHIQKSLMNLIINAADSISTEGKIRISTENYYADRLFTAYQPINEGEYVLLKIEDNGHGINDEDLEHIFEPFFSTKKMGKSGTGLGMAVVWGTVQDHNGSINIKTEVGKGTEFQLYFPATRERFPGGKRKTDRQDYTGNGEHILIVDDIKEQRELSCEILNSLGYTTTSASDAAEAISYIQNNPVDLIILDMILEDPKTDGLETYKKILKIKPGQKAVVASGYAENSRVKETMNLGAGQFIKKPFTIEKIGIAVKAELNNKNFKNNNNKQL